MRSMMNRPLVLALILAVFGCSETPTDPEPAVVAGAYAARDEVGVLRAERDQEVADLLADGARVSIVLREDGTTAGDLVLRAEDGRLVSHDLDGTWTLDGDSVLLHHQADTFLRDMRLRYEGGRLTGVVAWGIDGWRIRVALVRE